LESSSGYNKEIKRDKDRGRRETQGGKKRWRRKRYFKNRKSEEAREERDGIRSSGGRKNRLCEPWGQIMVALEHVAAAAAMNIPCHYDQKFKITAYVANF
jgi:hypothetical protein